MKKSTITFFVLILVMNSNFGQSKFGFEIRMSRNFTFNKYELIGSSSIGAAYRITNERFGVSNSFSLGITYLLDKRFLLKLHIGEHRKGLIFDLTYYVDFLIDEQLNHDRPHQFVQVAPSLVLNLLEGDIRVPLEVGIAMNKNIRIYDLDYVYLKEYTYDLRLAVGLTRDLGEVSLGVNFIYSYALQEYQREIELGKFHPIQLGGEFSIMYRL